jgi:ABC-2 type transport system permease protein
MLRLLIRKEIAEIIRSPKFWLTYGVMAALILLAFFMGAANFRVAIGEYEAAQAEARRSVEGSTSWQEVRTSVFLKPEPLHALVSGVSNDIGRSSQIGQYGLFGEARNSRFNADTIYAVFRLLDLRFVFGIALSLFAIVFGFDAVNGERERGTLALAMANAVPRDQILLGKGLGMTLALGLPLLIPILVGSLLLPLLGVPMEGGDWVRLALVVCAGFLYLGVFVTLSILVSSLTSSSSTSFLVLLVVWILAVLVVPRLAVMSAGKLVDVPSIDQTDHMKFDQSRQLMREQTEAMQAFWEEHRNSDWSQEERQAAFHEFWLDRQSTYNEKMDEFASRVDEDRRNRERVRQQLSLNLSRVSPTSVFGLAAVELAGTSLDLQHRYQDDVVAYRRQFLQFMTARLREQDPATLWAMDQEQEIDAADIPGFTMRDPATADLVGSALPDFAILFILNVVLFAGSVVAFRGYDVRY